MFREGEQHSAAAATWITRDVPRLLLVDAERRHEVAQLFGRQELAGFAVGDAALEQVAEGAVVEELLAGHATWASWRQPNSLPCRVCGRLPFPAIPSTSGAGDGSPSAAVATAGVHLTIGRCRLRTLDSWCSEVDTWDSAERIDRYLGKLRVGELVENASQALEGYPEWAGSEYARHTAFLNSLHARAEYLRGNFEEAGQLLKRAFAATSSGQGSEEFQARAFCELRRAECLILRANGELEGLGTAGEGKDISRRFVAQRTLGLAETALESCRETLAVCESSVWCWTLLYLQFTQLRHEQILLSFLPERSENCAGVDQVIRFFGDGLRFISAGLDNIAKDARRWDHFSMLWWQLYLCLLVFRKGSELFSGKVAFEEEWCRWKEWNEEAVLDWFRVREEERALPSLRERWAAVVGKLAVERPSNGRQAALFLQRRLLEENGFGWLRGEPWNAWGSRVTREITDSLGRVQECFSEFEEQALLTRKTLAERVESSREVLTRRVWR